MLSFGSGISEVWTLLQRYVEFEFPYVPKASGPLVNPPAPRAEEDEDHHWRGGSFENRGLVMLLEDFLGR